MSNYAKRREAEALSRKESNKKTAIIVLAVVAVAALWNPNQVEIGRKLVCLCLESCPLGVNV